jgi:hypothetical protein
MLVKFKSLSSWGEKTKKKFTKGKNFGGLTMCKKCYTFYYKHSWHLYRPEQLEKDNDSVFAVHFTECLSCLMESNIEEGFGYNSPARYNINEGDLATL